MEVFLSPRRESALWALAARIVPRARAEGEPARRAMMEAVEHALATRPAAMRRQMGLYLLLIRGLARARWLRSLEGLSAERMDRLLAWLEKNPVPILRQGFWGLKTLLLMGYYTRTEVHERIGYRPRLRGGGLGGA